MNSHNTQLTELEQQWAAAELRGDVGFLGELLADDFRAIGPRGFVLDKQQWLDRFKPGAMKYESFDWDEVEVHEHNSSAVVTGRQTQRATFAGNDASAELRVMQMLFNEDGRWRLAGLQMSPIMGPPPGK